MHSCVGELQFAGKTPSNVSLPVGSGLHLIGYMVPWTHLSQPPKGYLDRFSLFTQLSRVPNTHTYRQTTLRATSVTIGRIYELRAGDAAQK